MTTRDHPLDVATSETPVENVLHINRGRVDSIVIYEVTESELEELSSGASVNHLFEAFIALASAFIAMLSTILTNPLAGVKETIFVTITVGLAVLSVGFLIAWLILCHGRKSIVGRIKARVDTPSKNETASPDSKGV